MLVVLLLPSSACADAPGREMVATAGTTAMAITSSGLDDEGGPSTAADTHAGTESPDPDTTAEATSSTGPLDMGTPGFAPLRVLVVSDLNDSYGSTTYSTPVHDAVAAIVARAPDLVLSTGDMVAGQQAGLDYPAMWAGFHAAVSDELAAAGLPFAVSPGNHDASGYPAFAGERELFVAEWLDRKPELEFVDDSGYPLRYSFTAGAALFVALDSTTVGPLDAGQMQWLDEQLGQSDAPTKIVFGHVPLVPFAVGREDEIIGDPALEAMLEQHGVAMFISGHHHVYYPGRRGTVRYVSVACVGAGPRAWTGTETTSPRAVLELELDEDGTITVLEALAEPAFDIPIPRADLPASLSYGPWTVTRDDLAEAPLQ
jgi:3',5'-cyclic AMP phosphodiesterase CpdA